MLKIFLRENTNQNARSKYVFRSENEAVLALDKLIVEMAQNNTTMTTADVKGVMSVFYDVVVKYLTLGYSVKTPLGLLYVSAAGTADDLQDEFTPTVESSDHALNIRYLPDSAAAKTVTSETLHERVSNRYKMMPHIDTVQNASKSQGNEIKAGDMVRIYGDYLKFTESDESQGVFLEKDGTETRLSYYAWILNKRIETKIPTDLAAGSYTLIVRAKPSTVVYETKCKESVTIS